MAEVAGLALAVMPLFMNIMETVKTAIAIYHREEKLSMMMTKLYVERARLGEFARILGVVSEGATPLTLDSEHVSILQRIMTSSSEKLIETQRLIARHGYQRSSRSDAIKLYKDLIWARQDETRLSGLIQNLTELNDALYRMIMLQLLQKKSKSGDQSPTSADYNSDKSTSWAKSLVDGLWTSSVESLDVIGDKALKSLPLRRTFRRAIVRLTMWRDGFDFDLSQIELVLGTNEYLYEAVVITLSRLVYFLWRLINAAIEENVVLPIKLRAHMGRITERIKSAGIAMNFSIEDVDESEDTPFYRPLFIVRPVEKSSDGLEMWVKEEVNSHCAVLFELVGAIDRARKRHIWLLDLGKRSKDSAIKTSEGTLSDFSYLSALPGQKYKSMASGTVLATETRKPVSEYVDIILETEQNDYSPEERMLSQAAPRAGAKQLLSANIEAATTLYHHLQAKSEKLAQAENKKNANTFSEKPKPRVIPQLEQDVRDELSRLKQFTQEFGTELDGSVAERNGQIQEAATFALEHINHVLNLALTREELTRHHSWDAIPKERHQELDKVHRIEDTASAVRDFHDMNDSLAKLLQPIKIAETLPAYRSSPLSGELTVMRTSLQGVI